MYVRSSLHEKMEFCKNIKFGSVTLDSIIVAVLMLVYHVILWKFILYLKS